MESDPNLIFAAGMAMPSPSTPIAVQYDLLLLTFVFHRETGLIMAAEANMVCDITDQFLSQLLVGRCIYTDLDFILRDIQHTYLGISRPALLVCVKDAYDKIRERGDLQSFMDQKHTSSKNKLSLDRAFQFEYDRRRQRSASGGGAFMGTLPPTAICVVGLSKTGSRNPITKVHQSLMASLIVDSQTGEIYAAEFNTVCRLTNEFVTSLIVGKNLRTDVDELAKTIQMRYLGDSRRAIVTILKDAQNKLSNYMSSKT